MHTARGQKKGASEQGLARVGLSCSLAPLESTGRPASLPYASGVIYRDEMLFAAGRIDV